MVSVSDIEGGFGGAGLGLGAIGLAGSIFSGMQSGQYEQQAAAESMKQTQLDEQINAQRQQQMVLYSQRQEMQNYRNVQRTRAMGMAAAVNSGAQFGSGIAGGQSAASAEGAQNTRNLSQNLQIGQNIFGLTSQIDQSRIAQSQDLSNSYSAQGRGSIFSGLGSFGADIMKAGQFLGPVLGTLA